MIAGVTHVGRFQMILYYITLVLLAVCLFFSVIIFVRTAAAAESPVFNCLPMNADQAHDH